MRLVMVAFSFDGEEVYQAFYGTRLRRLPRSRSPEQAGLSRIQRAAIHHAIGTEADLVQTAIVAKWAVLGGLPGYINSPQQQLSLSTAALWCVVYFAGRFCWAVIVGLMMRLGRK